MRSLWGHFGVAVQPPFRAACLFINGNETMSDIEQSRVSRILRSSAARVMELIPAPVLSWVRRHPLVNDRLAPLARRLIHSGSGLIVTIPDGPNRGMKMQMYPGIPLAYWLAGQWEHEVEEAMRTYIRPGMIAVDLGAHAGYWTMAMSSLVGSDGRVLSFEPNPSTMARLQETSRINHLENVRLFELAASDRTGPVAFAALDDERSPSSRISDDAHPAAGVFQVDSTRLDDLWGKENLPDPGFVKLDVEDHEVAAIRGGREMLARALPVMLIEIHSLDSLRGCVDELSALGYSIRPLNGAEVYRKVIEEGARDQATADECTGFHILAAPAADRAGV
jgi:FkbM family methyltransferase